MEINVPWSEMQKRSLFLATPMYGGQNYGLFAKSVQQLVTECKEKGIYIQVHYLFNESLVTRARAYAAAEFMQRSTCTHFMFVDADIRFDAKDVFTLLALQSDESPYDVIGAVYPKKSISWEKVVQAVNSGMADNDPNVLEYVVGDYVFNPIIEDGKTAASFDLETPCEISELGTGFMMIRRATFEKYDQAFPELLYKPDHVRSAHFDGSKEIMMYFDAAIDPESRRYLSEDYFFCRNVRKFGGKIWFCPWIELSHIGTYEFKGSLRALSAIGAAATVDPSKLVKRKDQV